MKNTAAMVRKDAEAKGLQPVQIDGIPEGFSYKEDDITIGDVKATGRYVAFVPFNNDEVRVYAESPEELIKQYKQYGN